MLVSEAVGTVLARLGADTVFGVVGSGNFHVTNALIAGGARFIAARHECGAASMADGWARTAGRPGILSVHQGPGVTNALTGITEAAKSRTPLLVLAADVAASTTRSALPLDVQAGQCAAPVISPDGGRREAAAPAADAASALGAALAAARRPVFIAGRGARVAGARADLEALADACGALLATSAAAKGLFRGSPWDLDVSGGFASPLAAELIRGADLVVGWGCALNMWTLRHGTLISPGTLVAQVDTDGARLGEHRPVDLGVTGDVAATVRAVAGLLAGGGPERSVHDRGSSVVRRPRQTTTIMRNGTGVAAGPIGYRSDELRGRLAREIRWRDVPFADESDGAAIDPRTLTIALDDLLPEQRTVPVGTRPGRLLLHPGLPVDRPRAQLGGRRGDRPAGPADRGGAR
jgi:acetolactate synthase-1/2/3 large subunit